MGYESLAFTRTNCQRSLCDSCIYNCWGAVGRHVYTPKCVYYKKYVPKNEGVQLSLLDLPVTKYSY
jgi:hypothetical protein